VYQGCHKTLTPNIYFCTRKKRLGKGLNQIRQPTPPSCKPLPSGKKKNSHDEEYRNVYIDYHTFQSHYVVVETEIRR
jgi:hypothetical protein